MKETQKHNLIGYILFGIITTLLIWYMIDSYLYEKDLDRQQEQEMAISKARIRVE